jgi:hypothetical protein
MMFNPDLGSSGGTRTNSWKHNSGRIVYMMLHQYIDHIRLERKRLEETTSTTIRNDSFPLNAIEKNRIMESIVMYYIRKTRSNWFFQNRRDGLLMRYPNTFDGNSINLEERSVIMFTRKTTARVNRCRLMVWIDIDPNHLTPSGQRRLRDQARDASITINQGVCDFLVEHEDEVSATLMKFGKNPKYFNYQYICIQITSGSNNILSYFFIRAWLGILARKSRNGRDFRITSGVTVADLEEIADIKIWGEYRFRDLFYRGHAGKPFIQSPCGNFLNNSSKKFFANFAKNITCWGNNSYFDEWDKTFDNKGALKRHRGHVDSVDDISDTRDPSPMKYKRMLHRAMSDFSRVELEGLSSLLLYAKKKNTTTAPRSNEVPLIEVPLLKTNIEERLELDRRLRECTSRRHWVFCIDFVRKHGILTELFLETLVKTRIRFVYLEKALIAECNHENAARRTKLLENFYPEMTINEVTIKRILEDGQVEFVERSRAARN